jgi:hypothetical protein
VSTQLLPRFTAALQRIEDMQKIGRIVLDSEGSGLPATVQRATLPGDMRRLRGIPITGPGIGGTSPGTDPVSVLLASVT